MNFFQRLQESAPARLAPPPPRPSLSPSGDFAGEEEEEGTANSHDDENVRPSQRNASTKRGGIGSSSTNVHVLRVPSKVGERAERGTSMALDLSCTQCWRCSSLAGSNQMRRENEGEQRLFTTDEVKEMLSDYRYAYNKKLADLSRREMAVAAMERELRERDQEVTAREMRLRNVAERSTFLGAGTRPSSSYPATEPKAHGPTYY